jgi:signal transduction histidine kinase
MVKPLSDDIVPEIFRSVLLIGAPVLRLAVLRIVQEGLTNVLKHAGPTPRST